MKLFFTDGQKQGGKHELTPPGISIGRELDNDIILEQEGASRYHSKLEWKDSNWYLKDLGSTNGTQLNGEKITPDTELKLKEGDNIKIGKQTMHFADKLDESKKATPSGTSSSDSSDKIDIEHSAVTISDMTPSPKEQDKGKQDNKDAGSKSFLSFFDGKEPEKEKNSDKSDKLDFFGKQDASDADEGKAPKKHASILFYGCVLGAAVFLIAGFLVYEQTKQRKPANTAPIKRIRKGAPLLLRYEKQITTSKPKHNIFRYLMEIKDGTVTITRDDLQAGLKDQPSRKIGPDKLLELEEQLRETDFMSLSQGQLGLPRDGEDKIHTLTIAYGKEFNTIVIRNSSSPRAFEEVVRILEDDLSGNVLNIPAMSLTPEELLEDGMRAYMRGKQLFENYRSKNGNLFQAKTLLKVAIENLGAFQPQPPEYNEAYKMREEASRILQSQLHSHGRNASKYLRLKQYVQAKEEYQAIMEKTGPGSKPYNTSREKIIQIEEKIRRRKR